MKEIATTERERNAPPRLNTYNSIPINNVNGIVRRKKRERPLLSGRVVSIDPRAVSGEHLAFGWGINEWIWD